ncbi:MAG: hypothetical protein ABIQ52_03475 [Vicinamibacterales bacterium]
MIRRLALQVLIVVAAVLTARGALAQSGRPAASAKPARAAEAAAPLPVRVRASVDRTAIWVGDRVAYAADIVCDRGVEVLLDDLAKEKVRVNGLDVISSDTTTTVDASERTTYRLRYILTTYRVDMPSLSIEPLSARYYARRPGQRLQDIAPAGEVAIPGATVAFRSTLPDQPAYELRDRRAAAVRHALLARARSIGLALVVIALAPAAFVAVALLRRCAPKTGRRSARQARLDHRATLERLRSLEVTTAEDRRRAYDEISVALRQHVAATTGVPATGLTAAELDAALETAGGRVQRETVTALLTACDAARYGPPPSLPSAESCRAALSTAEQVLASR